MNTPVQVLVFDAYGTLFDPFSVQTACEGLFPGFGSTLSRLWRTKQLEYTWLRSLMNRYEDFWLVTEAALLFSCVSLRLNCTPGQREQLMQEYLRLRTYSDALPALANLSGKRLFVLSNGSPTMLEPLLESAGLSKSFSGLLSADMVKVYKPSRLVYQLALEAAGVDKSAIGFISSNSWDIAGATSFGFQTFWINRGGTFPEELGVKPGTVLRTLADLPALCSAGS